MNRFNRSRNLYFALPFVGAAILATSAFSQPREKPAGGEQDRSDAKFTIVYSVADLAVWRQVKEGAPEFAPSLLIAYIQSTVSPESWTEDQEIRPFVANASLVISQTRANHERIAELLQTFRPKRTSE